MIEFCFAVFVVLFVIRLYFVNKETEERRRKYPHLFNQKKRPFTYTEEQIREAEREDREKEWYDLRGYWDDTDYR